MEQSPAVAELLAAHGTLVSDPCQHTTTFRTLPHRQMVYACTLGLEAANAHCCHPGQRNDTSANSLVS